MSVLFLVLFFVFIILLIIIMFLLLKRLVFKVNQQSTDYFLDKLKVYDNLIDDREKKIKELNELINSKSKEMSEKEKEVSNHSESVFVYDSKNVAYKDEDIFKKMKEVDRKFHFDSKKIVNKFLEDKFDTSLVKDYNKYYKVRKLFNQEVIFNILTKKESRQLDEVKKLLGDSVGILDDFMKNRKKFDLKKFISYLNRVIDKVDPYVYIYVGDKSENYNKLSPYIKTRFDDSIFKGLRIMYRGKLYDYSI